MHRLRPQALGSAEVMLSSASSLLRPDPPVSQAPLGLAVWAAPTGLCLATTCVTFPSLLWPPSTHAISLTRRQTDFACWFIHPSWAPSSRGYGLGSPGACHFKWLLVGPYLGARMSAFATAGVVAWAAGQPDPFTTPSKTAESAG